MGGTNYLLSGMILQVWNHELLGSLQFLGLLVLRCSDPITHLFGTKSWGKMNLPRRKQYKLVGKTGVSCLQLFPKRWGNVSNMGILLDIPSSGSPGMYLIKITWFKQFDVLFFAGPLGGEVLDGNSWSCWNFTILPSSFIYHTTV